MGPCACLVPGDWIDGLGIGVVFFVEKGYRYIEERRGSWS